MSKTNEMLNALQADAMVFYQKLRAYHWTVTGERFFQLHERFEALYTRWAEVIDEIAERTVVNGGRPVLTLEAALRAAKIREAAGAAGGREMMEDVVKDLEQLVEALARALQAAEGEGDRGTVALLDEIRVEEEKTLWMLRAWLK
jgi:starvation-inducible DNA-binding protein